jgi:hypothetical protein
VAETTEIQILKRVSKARRGSLFFTDQFQAMGSSDAVRKALERLVKKGELNRVSQGIYYRPAMNPVIGPLTPGMEAIARAIAKRDKARIVPASAYALNRLGLSTQIPLNLVYLTDGVARKVKIGKRSITFKKASPKNLAAIGEISSLVIQALKAIGKDKITEEETQKVQELLRKEKPQHLLHDFGLAPAWIRSVFQPIIASNK